MENAALRELNEEVGISISMNDLNPFAEREFTIENANSHITYFYYIKTNLNEKDFVIQKEELSKVKWFDLDKVIDMIKSKDETIVFKKERIHLFEQLKNL